jgi:hypothetical protein
MWKNIVQPDILHMKVQYGVEKIKEYTVIISPTYLYLLVQWLHQCTLMLRCVYFACPYFLRYCVVS